MELPRHRCCMFLLIVTNLTNLVTLTDLRSRTLGGWRKGLTSNGNYTWLEKNYRGARISLFFHPFLPSLSFSSPLSPNLFPPAIMSPPPPPPPPPLCLPSFTRKGKKKQLAEFNDEKSASASHPSGSRSRTSRGSRSSLPTSQRQSDQGYPLTRSNSYSPTATLTDVQSRQDMIPSQTGLTFTEDTESYKNLPKFLPKLDRSRSKVARGNTLRARFGYGWTLGLGRKDKDNKDDLFTVDDRSSATTILPIYPRGAPSFVPDDSRTPTRHMSQRSKNSQASKQSNDTQASRATKSSNLSGGSKRSNNSKRPSLTGSGSVNTLVGSALERKEAYQDPIREEVDTYDRLNRLREHMAKDNLDY